MFGYGDSTFYGSFDILRNDLNSGEFRLRQNVNGTNTNVLSIVDANSTFTGSVRVANPTQSNYWLYNAAKTNGFLLGRSIGSNDAQDFFIFDTISNSTRLQINSVGDITFSNQATFGGDITIYDAGG